jgi:TonB family protein
MNRLQKKCFIVSASLHAMLLGIMLFGSAFLASAPKEEAHQALKVYDSRFITDALTSGGNPNVQVVPPPAPPAPEVQQPQPPQPQPLPPPPQPKPEPERPRVELPRIKPIPAAIPESITKSKLIEEPVKPKPKLSKDDLKMTKRPNSKPPETNDSDDSKARAKDAARKKLLLAQVNSTVHTLNQELSQRTTVELPGPGGGGPLAANYDDIVQSKYQAAWTPPPTLTDDAATVTVKVTIARDGTVVSGHIIKSSGIDEMDRSVRNTLDNVTFIAPFPEGSTDRERTYPINFNLKSKRLFG